MNGEYQWDRCECVCHYTSMATLIEYILKDMQIRFGLLSEMNDPRDAKQRALVVGWKGKPPHPEILHELVDIFEEIIGSRAYAFSCSLDSGLALDATIAGYPPNVAGRGFALGQMWAHYGALHRGVCLLLEKSSLLKAIENNAPSGSRCFTKKIEYSELPRGFVEACDFDYTSSSKLEVSLLEHIEQHADFLFFKKSTSWREEREFRAVVITNGAEQEVVVPIKEVLRGVVLGADLPSIYDSLIKKLLPPNASLARLTWDHGIPILS